MELITIIAAFQYTLIPRSLPNQLKEASPNSNTVHIKTVICMTLRALMNLNLWGPTRVIRNIRLILLVTLLKHEV